MSDAHTADVKKRLMFVKGEDFYFLTYNIILLLDNLGCTSSAKAFKDHRKLAFLTDFIADFRLTDILQRCTSTELRLHPRDRQELVRAYTDGAARIHLVTRLISAMEMRDLLTIERTPNTVTANIHLVSGKIPPTFIKSELYEQEHENIAKLLRLAPRVRTNSLSTTLNQLFGKCGVQIWHA